MHMIHGINGGQQGYDLFKAPRPFATPTSFENILMPVHINSHPSYVFPNQQRVQHDHYLNEINRYISANLNQQQHIRNRPIQHPVNNHYNGADLIHTRVRSPIQNISHMDSSLESLSVSLSGLSMTSAKRSSSKSESISSPENMLSPIGAYRDRNAFSNQSTPRPIRKLAYSCESSASPLASPVATHSPSVVHYKQPENNSNPRRLDEDQKTTANPRKRGSNYRRSSPPRGPKPNRQLPIRSKNIDLSKYLGNTNTNVSDGNKCLSKPGLNNGGGEMRCAFCENNRETKEVYMSHNLKDSLGKIVCPILRNFVCPKCGESGDYAHTDKYCPVTQRKQKENKIKKFFGQL